MAASAAAGVKAVDRASAKDVGFAVGIVFILTVLFLPMPAAFIDIGLAFSIALSGADPDGGAVDPEAARFLGLPDRPADRHAAAAVAQHRHHAPDPLQRCRRARAPPGTSSPAFASFVMSGDFVIGIIVFVILITVNFVVITKGATRIAEVGARFTLDAIPGKQMAIDADLNAGVIDDKEATRRRRELEEESAFFGSMDGASKFVRGDAIAGIIITAVNIFGGIVIGVTRHGMSPAEAANVFTKLSVGDGLVTQIPALIVSLAAGLLVSKGGTRGSTEKAVLGQLGNYPRALLLSALVMFVLALVPGLPLLPFALLGAVMGFIGYIIPKRRAEVIAAEEAKAQETATRGRGGGAPVGQGIAEDGRDRALPRQAALGVVPQDPQRTGPPRGQDAPQVRQAVRLRRPGDQARRRPVDSAQDLSDQDPRHGGRQRGAAHRRRARHHRRRAAARRSRRRGARAGLRHEGHLDLRDVRQRDQARGLQADRQHVGAAHPPARGHPQQPGAAAVLQGHAHAARPARAGIQAPARRDRAVADLLFRPAGGAEAAAGRAGLDPQPAPDPRGDRRDRAACAPRRADRRACAHAHGAADLRRPRRRRRAQGAAPRQPLGPRLPPEPRSATPRATSSSSTSIRARSSSSAPRPRR